MTDPTQNEDPTEGQPGETEDLPVEMPEEILADEPEAEPGDAEAGGGDSEPAKQHTWD